MDLFQIPGHDLPHWADDLFRNPGFIAENVSIEDYHSTRALISKSTLDVADKSGAHYQFLLDPTTCPGYDPDDLEEVSEDDKEELIVGNAFHTCVLEPMAFSRRYVELPDFGKMQSSTNRAIRDAWIRNEAGGRIPLKRKHIKMIKAMRESLMREPYMRKLLQDGQPEVTAVCIDPHTGLPLKARTDWLSKIQIGFDLKSAKDASRRWWRVEAGRRRAAVQAVFYGHVFQQAGIELDDFVFGVVEKTPPYAVGLYSMEEEDLLAGEQIYMRNLRDIRRWIETSRYPGYTNGTIETMRLPAYHREDVERAIDDL
jgi:hypothetical protein